MKDKSKYIQIIPANGWWAVYKTEGGALEKSAVVCIALDSLGEIYFLGTDSNGWIEEIDCVENFLRVEYRE